MSKIHPKINNQVMVDIETLSTRPDSVILVIGAIKFSRNGDLQHFEKLDKIDVFYRRITIESCTDIGLRIDDSTLNWWKQQNQKARYEALENPDRIPLKQALQEFSNFIKNSSHIWDNSPDFDCTILGEAFNRCEIEIPWKFWNTRDCRTLFDLGGVSKVNMPSGDEHNAAHDCYRQIVGVKQALKNLSL